MNNQPKETIDPLDELLLMILKELETVQPQAGEAVNLKKNLQSAVISFLKWRADEEFYLEATGGMVYYYPLEGSC